MVNKKKSAGKLHKKESSLSLFSIDDYQESAPAAGYRNGSSLNNAGSNGNYWSSTPYEIGNAYGLVFDSVDRFVYEYGRYYGQSVRPVIE